MLLAAVDCTQSTLLPSLDASELPAPALLLESVGSDSKRLHGHKHASCHLTRTGSGTRSRTGAGVRAGLAARPANSPLSRLRSAPGAWRWRHCAESRSW